MRISVGIATFDRPHQYAETINELRRELSGHYVDMFVIQDGGDQYVKSFGAKTKFHVRASWQENKGKALYWQTVNHLLELSKHSRPHFHLHLSDDLQFSEDWFVRVHGRIRDLGPFVALNILPCHRLGTGCWGIYPQIIAPGLMAPGFIDGAFIATYAAMGRIKWRVSAIDPKRWDEDPKLGSGVWKQVTMRMIRAQVRIYNLTDSGISTEWSGEHSKMNPNRERHEYRL